MNKIIKVILLIVILIVVLGVIWIWFLDCETKCKFLTLEVGVCKEKGKCFGTHPIIGYSRDCHPKECCCYMLE